MQRERERGEKKKREREPRGREMLEISEGRKVRLRTIAARIKRGRGGKWTSV